MKRKNTNYYYVGDMGGKIDAHFTIEEWDKMNTALGLFGSGFAQPEEYHAEGRNTWLGCCKFIVYRHDRTNITQAERNALYWYFLGVRHSNKIVPMDEDEVAQRKADGERRSKEAKEQQ